VFCLLLSFSAYLLLLFKWNIQSSVPEFIIPFLSFNTWIAFCLLRLKSTIYYTFFLLDCNNFTGDPILTLFYIITFQNSFFLYFGTIKWKIKYHFVLVLIFIIIMLSDKERLIFVDIWKQQFKLCLDLFFIHCLENSINKNIYFLVSFIKSFNRQIVLKYSYWLLFSASNFHSFSGLSKNLVRWI
jgi:hypothetical protein